MRKKSQIQAQIFIYIMVLVVGVGILLYGYSAIKGFKTQSDDVLYLQFENSLKNDFKSISFESTRVKSYEIPSTVSQICFKALGAVYPDVTLEEQRQSSLKTNYKYPLISDAVQAGTENNVFIYPRGEKAFFSGVNLVFGELDSENHPKKFKCFQVSTGVLKIKIKGLGKEVLVTE